jgi:hypothetical protein
VWNWHMAKFRTRSNTAPPSKRWFELQERNMYLKNIISFDSDSRRYVQIMNAACIKRYRDTLRHVWEIRCVTYINRT